MFSFIGVLSNVCGYVVYLCMTRMGMWPKMAFTLIYVISASFSFFGNGRYTFGQIKKEKLKKIRRYIFVYFLGYLINLGCHFLLVDILEYSHEVAQVVGIFIVAIYMFIVLSNYVFYEKRGE